MVENFDTYPDVAQGNGMAKRNQMRRLLRCLNSRNPRGCDDIALLDFVFTNEIGGLVVESDPAGSDCGACAQGLRGDIDHLRPAIGADVS